MNIAQLQVDPIRLGNLEVGWWRAHHDKDKSRMTQLLIEQNMALYGITSEDAKAALQDLIGGVNYHDTRQWNEAVSAVTGYYQKIKEKTGLRFNPSEVAKLEVDWWQLHDKLEHNPDKTPLAGAFAKLYAAQFGLEIEKMKKAGQLKAEATREHDFAEDPDILPNEVKSHWDKANQLLVDFYGELKNAMA